ncbi:MAG: M64 family metallopeptidase [bacterium]
MVRCYIKEIAMYKLYRFLIYIILSSFMLVSIGYSQDQYWQLTFSYTKQSLTLIAADKIPMMQKKIQTPGINGAPLKLKYSLTWIDAQGNALGETIAEFPLGIRLIMDSGEPCKIMIPEESAVVVRIPGPMNDIKPASIRLVKSGVTLHGVTASQIPAVFQFQEQSFVIPEPLNKLFAGPISSAKIRDTGIDSNRLVFVVMGDGYTLANLTAGTFTTHAQNFVNAFKSKSPWDVYFNGTNVYRIDIESNEQGADEPPNSIYVDTYLNSTFWTSNIERLLTINGTGYSRAIAAANSLVGTGVWDYIFVLVNSTRYGGSGGSISVASIHSASNEVVLHECGHTFAGLADEYEDAYPGYPDGDWEPNVDYDYSGTGLKWLVWVESGTPLPTPESSSYDTIVGAFEGARYKSTGIYRPWYSCEMRSLNRPFCPVCKQAHAIEYTNIVNLADGVSPSTATTVSVGAAGVDFIVAPIPITPIIYEWRLNSTLISDATSKNIFLTNSDLTTGTNTLEVKIMHPTSLIRTTSIYDTYTWNLVQASTAVDVSHWYLLK